MGSTEARERRHVRSFRYDTPEPMGTATETIHGAAGPALIADAQNRRNQDSANDVCPVVQLRANTGDPSRAAIAQSHRRGMPRASMTLTATQMLKTGRSAARMSKR